MLQPFTFSSIRKSRRKGSRFTDYKIKFTNFNSKLKRPNFHYFLLPSNTPKCNFTIKIFIMTRKHIKRRKVNRTDFKKFSGKIKMFALVGWASTKTVKMPCAVHKCNFYFERHSFPRRRITANISWVFSFFSVGIVFAVFFEFWLPSAAYTSLYKSFLRSFFASQCELALQRFADTWMLSCFTIYALQYRASNLFCCLKMKIAAATTKWNNKKNSLCTVKLITHLLHIQRAMRVRLLKEREKKTSRNKVKQSSHSLGQSLNKLNRHTHSAKRTWPKSI